MPSLTKSPILRNISRYCAVFIGVATVCASQPYSESSVEDTTVIIQAQLDGDFKDQSSQHRNLRVFGNGAGAFQFAESGLPAFGRGLQGYVSGDQGNGSNFEVPEAAPAEFTIEVVVTILPGYSNAGQYGIAGRDELKGTARYFQFYKDINNQLAAIVFDSSLKPHFFSASNTPDIMEGHTYFFALTCKNSQISFYAADLTQDDPATKLTVIDKDTLDAPLNTASAVAPLIIGDKSAEYASPATPIQFDMVRYRSVARSTDDFQNGLSLKRP